MPITQTKRILVIDDNCRLTHIVKLCLEHDGYEVHSANEPLLGIQVARQLVPDLILLDIDMPGMNGGDVAAELRNDRATSKVPIVFYSALVTNREGARNGNRYLSKTATREELLTCVEEVLAGRK